MSNTTASVTVTWGNGRTGLLKGTPLDQYGNVANNGSVYGILSEDLNMPDRTATVITAGEWDDEISRQNGIPLSDAAKAKLSGITFTNPPPPVTVTEGALEETLADYAKTTDLADYAKTTDLADYAKSSDLADYVQTSDLATTEAAGLVSMAAAVADSEEADSPTTAEFNGLLSSLRTAGILETPAAQA